MKREVSLMIIGLVFLLSCSKQNKTETDIISGTIIPEKVFLYHYYDSDNFKQSFVDLNNDILMIGETSGTRDEEMFVQKINQNGDVLWKLSISDTCEIYGNSIIQTADLGYLAVGSTQSYPMEGIGMVINKISEDGDLLWSKKYYNWLDGNGRNRVLKTSDNQYVIFGKYITSNRVYYPYLIKMDQNGDSIFSKRLTDNKDVYTDAVIKSRNGGFLLLTTQRNNSHIDVIKLDDQFSVLWTKSLYPTVISEDLNQHISGSSLVEDNQGDIWIIGSSRNFNGSTPILIKTDAQGNEIFRKFENEKYGKMMGSDIVFDVDNNPVCSSFSSNDVYSKLIKIDKDGNLLYTKQIEHYEGENILLLNSNKIALFGNTFYNSFKSSDMFYLIMP